MKANLNNKRREARVLACVPDVTAEWLKRRARANGRCCMREAGRIIEAERQREAAEGSAK